MPELISSPEQLVENIRRYGHCAAGLAELMPYARSWYALRSKNTWLLGPSKFVGYQDMSAEEYLGSSDPKRRGRIRDAKAAMPGDGRVTEGVLKRWADLVEQGHPDFQSLHTALNKLCARFGKKPNTLARISIVRTGPEPHALQSGDDLVALLAAVFRDMTPAQKTAFRKQVE
jgi:hypothetical protein